MKVYLPPHTSYVVADSCHDANGYAPYYKAQADVLQPTVTRVNVYKKHGKEDSQDEMQPKKCLQPHHCLPLQQMPQIQTWHQVAL